MPAIAIDSNLIFFFSKSTNIIQMNTKKMVPFSMMANELSMHASAKVITFHIGTFGCDHIATTNNDWLMTLE